MKRRLLIVIALALAAGLFGRLTEPAVSEVTYDLLVSTSANRSNPVPLAGQTVAGNIYVFTSPDTGVTKVRFWVDDPARAGSPYKTESSAPFDLAGTVSSTTASPYYSTRLPNGAHTVTAELTLSGGATQVVNSQFTVNNTYGLVVSFASDRSGATALDGASVFENIYVFATTPPSGVSSVKFFIDDPGMAGAPYRTENSAPYDLEGGSSSAANPYKSTTLSDASHTMTALVALSGGGSQTVNATFAVTNNLPRLVFSPTTAVFATEQGGSAPTQTVALAVEDSSAIGYTVTENASWLTVSPMAGTTPDTLTLSVDSTGLPIGKHTTTVSAAPGASGYFSGALTVTLNVTADYDLQVSSAPDRSSPAPLEGATASGNMQVFVLPETGVTKVTFYVDDPARAGAPHRVEQNAPFDLNGTAGDGTAVAYDTALLSDGAHTVTMALDLVGGGTLVETSTFSVDNLPPALTFTPSEVPFTVPEGGSASQAATVGTDDGASASFSLSESVSWVSISPDSGGTPGAVTVSVDSTGLVAGVYSGTVHATSPTHAPAKLKVTMTVGDTQGCSPLACSQILVTLPYELTFSQDHSKLLDKNGTGTGFSYIDQPSNGSGYVPDNLEVDMAAGTLKITTTAGLASAATDSQDNALAVGIDAPSQVTLVRSTLVNPPAGTGNYQQGGVWFGNDEDNYVKIVVISTASGTIIEYLMEQNGSHVARQATAVMDLASSRVELRLRADPNSRTIQGSYRINSGPVIGLATFTAPGEFFSFDAAGINPLIGTRSWGGVFASHRLGPNPLVYTFDDFVVEEAPASPDVPPDAGAAGISFTRTSHPLSFPTSMVWGPDDRLYVTELFGKIHALTFDSNKQVIGDQLITSLRDSYGGGRLMLGIAIDPASTPSNVTLWVSHSNASLNDGEPNSGTVSRLSGANFSTVDHVITGLPRAKANHAINSLHFGPDGKLYIAAGGNTGAGAPNTANTEFGTMEEQPLSAALLVADVKNPSFDGSCHNASDIFGPPPCDVVTYATGMRNMYDFVFHSNGGIYGPDNGLGVTGTFPPSPTPPCFGFGDTSSYTQGGDNPGSQPDLLYRILPGKYYGHPDPYRNECVFKDGSYQGVPALPNFEPPIHNLGASRSADGTIEYLGDSFCGALKNEILIANYSVGDNITRTRLSADGTTVVAHGTLASGFTDPLPLAQSPDGTIYVGEFGSGMVTALKPLDSGCWSTKQGMPVALLDVGGTALDGKLYVVAGKTGAGPRTTMYIYDPATDTWSQGPNMPGVGVENPAVVAHNGKLYVFGGSTLPFSGATTQAAVYDPATDTWASLPPMSTGRGGPTAQVLDGKIYVVGGMSASGASLDSVEVFNPASLSWSTAASMSTRRDNPGSAVLDGKLYIFGGRTREANGTTLNGTLNTVEMYDPSTDTWTARAPMPTGRRTMVVGTLNGRAQVMGGEITSSGATFPQNEEYDALTDTWRSLTAMLTPRHGAAAGTINGVVYVAAGGPTGGSSFSNVLEAFAFQTGP